MAFLQPGEAYELPFGRSLLLKSGRSEGLSYVTSWLGDCGFGMSAMGRERTVGCGGKADIVSGAQ